ncbi:MAG TPA: hypothetical protein VJ778_09890 [Burkholderiales bacterium]|jgi:hypothetical protein|nr:hypothetical protein [Burkholderiales bacterium]HJS77710.1 hypothetical protein [Burkholderiales bacterium]
MVHVFSHHEHPDPHEHPVIAWIAIIAIVAAMLLIAWARLEIHGTDDLEAALTEPPAQGDLPVAPKPDLKPDDERELDAAVTSSRFATGFSP